MRISIPTILTTLAAIGFGLDLVAHFGPQALEPLWQPHVSDSRDRQVAPPVRVTSAFPTSLSRSDNYTPPLHPRAR